MSSQFEDAEGAQRDADTCSTAATEVVNELDEHDGLTGASEHAYGYRPPCKEIMSMKVPRLRALAATYNLDPQYRKPRLMVDLVRLFHGDEGLAELGQKICQQAKADQKLKGKKRKRR